MHCSWYRITGRPVPLSDHPENGMHHATLNSTWTDNDARRKRMNTHQVSRRNREKTRSVVQKEPVEAEEEKTEFQIQFLWQDIQRWTRGE